MTCLSISLSARPDGRPAGGSACKPWCSAHTGTWKVKCSFSQCNACSECSSDALNAGPALPSSDAVNSGPARPSSEAVSAGLALPALDVPRQHLFFRASIPSALGHWARQSQSVCPVSASERGGCSSSHGRRRASQTIGRAGQRRSRILLAKGVSRGSRVDCLCAPRVE